MTDGIDPIDRPLADDATGAQVSRSQRLWLWVVIVFSLTVHVACLIAGRTVLLGWRCEHHPVHASVEMAGSLIALSVAWLLMALHRRGLGTSYNIWIGAALAGMGILDGLHATVHAGQSFVWLHSAATFVGGSLFALVWLPRALEQRVSGWWGWSVSLVVLTVGILSLACPEATPPMLTVQPDGTKVFSLWAKGLNISGGALMLLAAVRLFTTYRAGRNIDDLLFCLHCTLFGAAAIMFEQSQLWDLPWWGWHLLRLMAYGVALWFVVLTAIREDELLNRVAIRLKQFNQTLEAKVTERTAALEQARQQAEDFEHRFRLIFESAASGLLLVEGSGEITLVNKPIESLFGYSRDELVGQPIEILVPEKIRPDHVRLRDSYFSRPRQRRLAPDLQLTGRTSAGLEVPVEIALCPVQFDDRMCVLVSVIDITERKRFESELVLARDQAESANRAKSEFLANMSHEIRTPLNAVIGLTEVVLRTSLQPDQKDHLRTVIDSAESLLSVINDILDFSKIEAGRLELEEVPFDLHAIVGDTLKALAVRADYKQLELACFIDPVMPASLIGDPARLRQVLTNLVGNAIKFTERGEVVVRVRPVAFRDKLTVRVEVSDTGIGIRKEQLSRLFQPFSQADASTTRRYGGTGLGLNICSQLVERMGGEIGVSSMPGRGSTFYFTATFGVLPESQQRTRREHRQLSGTRVLIVDDNATNRSILAEVTRAKSMIATLAGSAVEGLKSLHAALDRNEPFHLLLSDVHMPDQDGFEFVAAIRRDQRLDPLGIIFLTSAGYTGDLKRCQELRVAERLLKPVNQSELLEVILRTLGIESDPHDEGRMKLEGDRATLIPPQRILLAEDSRANQQVALAILNERGHEVTIAENGIQALAFLQQQPFDIVLMDVQMPEMDGFEATTQIRERERATGDHLQIIAMTAHAIRGDRERCLAAGMDDYVAKPVRREDLFLALADAVKRRESVSRTSGSEAAAARATGQVSPVSPRTVDSSSMGSSSGAVHASLGRLLEQLNGDRTRLRSIAQAYLDETAEYLDGLSAALESGDAKEFKRRAHTMKSGLKMLGADDAAGLALQLEELAATGDLSGAEDLVAVLDPLVRATLSEVSCVLERE